MNLTSFSKLKIAIAAAVLYTAVMGGAMFYMKDFKVITYGEPEMGMTFLWGLFFAPLMLKFNNIVPLIIFHWLWDFVVFVAPLMGEQVHRSVGAIALLNIPIEIIVSLMLWLQIKQVPDRAIRLHPSAEL